MRRLFYGYRYDAKKRDYIFDLSEEQFKELTQQDCHYCGAKPSNISKGKEYNGVYIYNGLDRVNNNKGYTIDNIVPCCRRCNRAKNSLTLQKYEEWIINSYNSIIKRRTK